MLASAITDLGKTVLLVVAITFILWSLYTALVIPKRHPGFPRRLDLFIVLSAVLFVAQMAAVVWVTGTQAIEHEAAAATEPTETEPATTEPATTEPAETAPSETTPAETQPGSTGDAAAGKEIFASAGCGSCHTLADAGATGAVGPNLDDAKPSEALVVDRVTNGKGVMQSFSDQLDEQQIADVAAYVSSVAGTS